MRKVRQFLKKLGVAFENETAQREMLKELLPTEIAISKKPFHFVNDEGESFIKTASLIMIKDIKKLSKI